MARVEIYKVVQDQNGNLIPNVTFNVVSRGGTAPANNQNCYSNDSTATASTQPVSSSSGVIRTYVEPGAYDLLINGVGFSQITIRIEAVSAASSQTYSLSNVTPDRAIDADSTTMNETADVVGTIINDLKNAGLAK